MTATELFEILTAAEIGFGHSDGNDLSITILDGRFNLDQAAEAIQEHIKTYWLYSDD